jgi:hypothetical protein
LTAGSNLTRQEIKRFGRRKKMTAIYRFLRILLILMVLIGLLVLKAVAAPAALLVSSINNFIEDKINYLLSIKG